MQEEIAGRPRERGWQEESHRARSRRTASNFYAAFCPRGSFGLLPRGSIGSTEISDVN